MVNLANRALKSLQKSAVRVDGIFDYLHIQVHVDEGCWGVGSGGWGGGRRSGMLPFGRHGNPSFLSPYKMFAEKNKKKHGSASFYFHFLNTRICLESVSLGSKMERRMILVLIQQRP